MWLLAADRRVCTHKLSNARIADGAQINLYGVIFRVSGAAFGWVNRGHGQETRRRDRQQVPIAGPTCHGPRLVPGCALFVVAAWWRRAWVTAGFRTAGWAAGLESPCGRPA